MYYDENSNYFGFYDDLNRDIFVNKNSNNNYYSPSEGLNKGNMFKSLYNPYKNYSYKIITNSKKEQLLLNIQELTFATKDLNLYLDLHPQDRNALELFKKYSNELTKLKEKYNKDYDSLCANEVTKNYFDWSLSNWPWSNDGGNSYV